MGKLEMLFDEIISKLNGYEVVFRKGKTYSGHFNRSVFVQINFDVIFSSINRYEPESTIKFIEKLIEKTNSILNNKELLETVAKTDDVNLDFDPLEKCIEYRQEDLKSLRVNLYDTIKIIRLKFLENAEGKNAPLIKLGDKRFKFKASVVQDLLNLEIGETHLFEDDCIPGEDDLHSFISGRFSEIKKEINIVCREKRVGYYLSHFIFLHSSVQKKDVKNFNINGEVFNPSNCSKEVSKINKDRKERILKEQTLDEIDTVEKFILQHLK